MCVRGTAQGRPAARGKGSSRSGASRGLVDAAPTPPRLPLLLLAAGAMLLFALVEFLDGWYVHGFDPARLGAAYLEHGWHITSSLALAAGLVAGRAWWLRREDATDAA